jgi:hypothetical protein
MENMKGLNNFEQYRLSEKYTIYKTTYNNRYSKKDFLKRIKQNEFLYHGKKFEYPNSLELRIECEEFRSIDELALNFLRTELSQEIDRFVKSSWIYVQVPDFNMEWMHTHEWVESSNRTKLKTQWTYVFYIQIPSDLKDGEGNLIFKTEDGELHVFTPRENDLLFFPGDLQHMPTLTASAKSDRISYTTNINYDFNYFRKTDKRINFHTHIITTNVL